MSLGSGHVWLGDDGFRPMTRTVGGVACFVTRTVQCDSCKRENVTEVVHVDRAGGIVDRPGPRDCGCRIRALVAMQRGGML